MEAKEENRERRGWGTERDGGLEGKLERGSKKPPPSCSKQGTD